MSRNIQQCTVGGYLYGIICQELGVYDRIGEAEIYAVRSKQNEATANPTAAARGDAKTVLRTVVEAEIKRAAAAGQGVLEGTTDEHGFFCLNNRDYQGELLDVYVCLNAVPLPGERTQMVPLRPRICLFLGTYVPVRGRAGWYLKLFIPSSIWCALKRKADVWTVAGRVADCATAQRLGNVTVIARDVDIIQSDLLGQGVTNSLGIFRIDYMGAAFRKGTKIDIELFGGPDIYFELKDSNGNALLTEASSAGRQVGRCDSGPCKCVRLCVELPHPGEDTGPDDQMSNWTYVGTSFLLPDSPAALNAFDLDGYAHVQLTSSPPTYGPSKFVLTGAPNMRGGVPRKTPGGDPVEFRFLVGDTTAANSAAALAASHFTRIVGAGPLQDKSLFAETDLGYVQRVVSFSPLVTETIQISAMQSDLSADGWLDVNKVIENRFVELGRDPTTIAQFSWTQSGNLMRVSTGALPTAPDISGTPAAGHEVPVGSRIPIQQMALRFETRNATTHAAQPGSGKTLNALVVNNNAIYVRLAIKEQTDNNDLCGIIHVNPPHISYTVYHPHLLAASIVVQSNSGAYNHNLNDPEPPAGVQRLPLNDNNDPAVANLNRLDLNLPGTLTKCTYSATLTAYSRLHNGDSGAGGPATATSLFYFDPAP